MTRRKYCEFCGSKLGQKNFQAWNCLSCDRVLYRNPKTTVGVILLNEKDEVILVLRSHDPYKLKWDLPGGFLQSGESAEQAVKREMREELGIGLKNLEYIGSYPDTYAFQKTVYDVVTFVFMARVPKQKIKPNKEIIELRSFSFTKLPVGKMAFPKSNLRAVKDFLKIRNTHARNQ